MNNILDNSEQYGTVGGFLSETIFADAELSFVSAYFSIYAFYELREKLLHIKKLRFLFGEPAFLERDIKPQQKTFALQEHHLSLSQHLQQKAAAEACAEWIQAKVDIKTVDKPDFLHAKLYLIKNPPSEENKRLHSVVGSSNFTINGLSFGKVQKNLELNLITDSNHDIESLEKWFNHLWNGQRKDVQISDVKIRVLAYLEQLYRKNTPNFIYHKTLYHLFESERELDESLPKSLENSEIWKILYEFQKNAVKQIIHKINQYNGCILADSVGLGKTFTALAVIKYFELRNQHVLVLCPKKLQENWRKYRFSARDKSNPFIADQFNYTLLAHTDLTRSKGIADGIDLERFNWDAYDLVVIDESHHFRNATQGYEKDGNYRQSRYEKLLNDVIKAGAQTKVLLLSATPVNNNLTDFLNQIRLITHDNDTAFLETMGIQSIEKTLKDAQKKLDKQQQETITEKNNLVDKLDKQVAILLDKLTIARSRQQIKTYFANSLKSLGNFPQRKEPINEYVEIESLKYDDLVEQINSYKLSMFNPSAYIKAKYLNLYVGKVKNFDQQTREYYLIGMMRVNFLKRLESSIFSFKETLKRTLDKIDNLQAKLTQAKEKSLQFADLQTADASLELEENDDFEWGNLNFKLSHLKITDWLSDLKQDKQQLASLLKDVEGIKTDNKLEKLREFIADKINTPFVNKNNRKVLIFTAFADTARYLYDKILPLANSLNVNMALVTGGSSNQSTVNERDFNKILTLFSPRSKEKNLFYPNEINEIDILIATDCISEGQNLQDCDCVVNYDIHWNPVRIIQRFGRIDRLGSQNEFIQMINFWAGKDLESYLQLETRVKSRMKLVDAATTTDENLLEEKKQSEREKNYRDHQLILFKKNVPELNDDGIQLENFSFTEFQLALQTKSYASLENEPLGMYAVVPENENYPTGVIFCLKSIDLNIKTTQQNYLHPYFLVYVKKRENSVHYGFTDAHNILTMFKTLCLGKNEIYEDFCQQFNRDTKDGKQMDVYNTLLKTAIDSFKQTAIKKSSDFLSQSRSATLFSAEEVPSKEMQFELITWLIIQEVK